MPDKKLKVAIVGGGIGVSHIKGYRELPDLFEIDTICDIDQAKAQKLAAEFQIPNTCYNFDQLLTRTELDIIDICTPPYLHYSMIKAVLNAGKHAICEKPLVESVAQIDELIRLENQTGWRMMPIFQYRFGHGLQKLKLLLDQNVTGQPYVANVDTAWRRREAYYEVPWRGKWKTEMGGAVLGHAIHANDMLTYIFGPIKSVFARVATRVNDIEVEDCAAISLEMQNGALAALSVTLGSSEEITRHRFTFRNLSAESNTRPYTNSGDPWVFTGDTPEATSQIETTLAGFKELPESYAGEFYRFYQALQTGGALPVTLQDARNSIELVTAIYLSAETGQAVSLPLEPGQVGYTGWMDFIKLPA